MPNPIRMKCFICCRVETVGRVESSRPAETCARVHTPCRVNSFNGVSTRPLFPKNSAPSDSQFWRHGIRLSFGGCSNRQAHLE